MVRLKAVAEGEAPPDLAKARHLHREHLLALRVIQIIEEEVRVQVVLDLTHDAVEHQETVSADPIKDAVVLNDGLR